MTPTEKAEELMLLSGDYAVAQSDWLRKGPADGAGAAMDTARSTLRAAIEQALREARAVPAEALRLAKVAVDECPDGAPMVCDWMEAAMQACRAMLAAAPAQPAAEPAKADDETRADFESWIARRDSPFTNYELWCAARLSSKPAAEPAALANGLTEAEAAQTASAMGLAAHTFAVPVTVEHIHDSFGIAWTKSDGGWHYVVNRGTKGIDFASLKPGMRLTAQVNERHYVVSATVEGE